MNTDELKELFNGLLGDEFIAHFQYTIAAHTVRGTDFDTCKTEFAEHAKEEYEHAETLLDIMQEFKIPVYTTLKTLIDRSMSGYPRANFSNSKRLTNHHIQGEQNAIDAYTKAIEILDDDKKFYGVVAQLKKILNDELKHKNDLEKVLSSIEDNVDESLVENTTWFLSNNNRG